MMEPMASTAAALSLVNQCSKLRKRARSPRFSLKLCPAVNVLSGGAFFGDSMQLSEHFSLEELTQSDLADRHGIDNTPPPDVLTNLKRLCEALEKIRALTGKSIQVTSGYRSEAVNKLAGGSDKSAHTKGLAADIKCQGYGTPLELCKIISSSDISFDQIIHEYRRWCHIAISDSPRKMLLTKNVGQAYKTGLA